MQQLDPQPDPQLAPDHETVPTTVRTTPLHDVHRVAGAKFVNFGGWEMPLHYGSQVEEHHVVRNDAGLFDVSHMGVVDVAGPEARAYLRYVLSNDIDKCGDGGYAIYSCMLGDDGGVLDDLLAYPLPEGNYRLVVNAANADDDFEWLDAHAGRFDVSVSRRGDLCMLALQGPQARNRAADVVGPDRDELMDIRRSRCRLFADGTMVARTGYTGEDGWEVIVSAARVRALWEALVGAGFKPCGLGARDTLRMEAGLHLHGQDMDKSVLPFDCGLERTVALEPADRDFIGRGALAAGKQQTRFIGLFLEAPGVLRAGQSLSTSSGPGLVTSGGYSPTLKRSIGLARIPLDAEPECRVQIRGKWLPVRCTRPKFVGADTSNRLNTTGGSSQ